MALNNPLTGHDDGQVGMPAIQAGMNKKPGKMGKGRPEDDRKDPPLGQKPVHSEKDDQEILARARKRMEWCITASSDNRKAMLQDKKFKKGDQWPADIAALRAAQNRPCLTINKLPTFIHQVTNDLRQNRPSVKFSPVGDKGDVEAAKVYRGMFRAMERDSNADIAYDTATDDAVSVGLGYFRLMTDWEDHDSFQQVLKIQRIRNMFTVYMDPLHQEPDGADANFCFVTEIIPKDEFEAQFPDQDISAFEQGTTGDKYKDWTSKDGIRIAEYFEKVREPCTLVKLSNGHVGFEEDLSKATRDQIASGKLTVVSERETYKTTVKWYKLTAIAIIERSDWLGSWIPIIPVLGDETDVEGKVTYSGVVRHAIDSQRMYNYWKTSETEMVALAPKAPWVVEEGQIEGYEEQWKNANTTPNAFLPYRGVNIAGSMAPPPQRQGFAQVPAGIVNAAQGASQDMMATTGIRFDATQQERMVDESGKAIHALQRMTDLGSYHYTDNFRRSLIHLGKMFVEIFPKIYDTERQATILRQDGKEEVVVIDPNANAAYEERKDPKTGKTMKVFNPSVGKYGIDVDTGPSYETKRIEASASMMAFAKALPNTAGMIADLIAKNQDWPGAEEMAARLAKAVPAQLMTPDKKDMTPQIQAVIQNLETQVKASHQQLQQAMAQLNDKNADRDVAREKINADFEAKILAIVQKAEDSANKEVGRKLEQLAEGVNQLMSAISPTRPAAQAGQQEKPADASGSTS